MNGNSSTDERHAELLASFKRFRKYVNAMRADSGMPELGDHAMTVAYAICHEFWSKSKQSALIVRLGRMI